MAATGEFVPTSIARRMVARIQATHEQRRISVFSGPPGIGKTTAIDEFARRNARQVVVVKVAKPHAREVLVLQHTLEALRWLAGSSAKHVPSSLWELRRGVFSTLCELVALDPHEARRRQPEHSSAPPMTVVFDEAQNLSREAIEALRYWNDADRCYAPFPLGLVFVGNSEFSLAGASAASSVISAAVADRSLYLQSLEYDDVTDDDLELMIEAACDIDPSATAAVVRAFRGPRVTRSLRRLAAVVEELEQLAAGSQVSTAHVRQVLS